MKPKGTTTAEKSPERKFPRIGALAPDLSSDVEDLIVERLRSMSAAEKLKILAALTQTTWYLALMEVRRQNPSASDRECLLAVASRVHDKDLLIAAISSKSQESSHAA